MTEERRKVAERRRKPTKPLSRFSFRGSRKNARRTNEAENYYVDRYESHYFVMIVFILILCVMDAYLTLKILHFGGQELNLLMLMFFNSQPILSMIFKYLITAVCITIILIHKNFILFEKVRVYHFIYFVLAVYSTLVLYEFYIILMHGHASNSLP